ncbi:LysR substrate-binding domain-containing protein [Variovorax humicola]|uniref:LysR substrate-binding domain-containing protein n=1 Tax=Variovorax humicola TaxID=1769758 RepID=A0ABU8W524_9BURK
MPHFDIDQLRTFAAVVDAGSLTAGAARVFLSQSAVSEQVRKLEERAGQLLFLRAKSGVSTTAAGDKLLAHARRLLALSDEAYRDMHGVALQGELRLAVTDYFRPLELARLLARLGEHHPQVRLNVSVLKSGEIEAGYARGEFDVGLSMRLAGVSSTLERGSQALRQEALQWMASPGVHPAKGEPLRLLALPDTCSLHQFTVGLLRRRKLAFNVVHIASGVAGLQSALAAGLGVACLNESSLSPGVVRLAEPHGLPALPRASFFLLPPRAGEDDFVARARELLAQQFA